MQALWIVRVFRVPVVMMMKFVATNFCVATATKTERSLKRNGQPTSTTTSRQKEESIDVFLLDINYSVKNRFCSVEKVQTSVMSQEIL